MTSTDAQALIEEARRVAPRKNWTIDATSTCDGCGEVKHLVRAFDVDDHNEPWLCAACANDATLHARLADALESSEAARRDLTDKIEALAEKWKRLPRDVPAETAVGRGYDEALHDCAADLRGLVSGDNKERRGG